MSFDLELTGRRALVTAGTKDVGAAVVEPAPVSSLHGALVTHRIILAYDTKAGAEIASIDGNSGRLLNHTQLSASSGRALHTWWSPDGNVLLMRSQDRR